MNGPASRLGHALPASWTLKPLRSVADYAISSVDKVPSDDEVPVRLCNYTDVYNNEFITEALPFMEATATTEEIRRFGLRVDDVIITKDSESWDDIGIPALVRETADDIVCGYHLAILRPREDLDGAFLLRCLQAKPIRVQLELAANGVTRFGIPKSEIGFLALPIPPIPQQRAIADYLDRETGRIDALVAAKERLLELLAEKRRALITRAVTQGLNPDAPLRDSGNPWLGEIPADWDAVQLRRAAVVIDCKHRTVPFVDDGVPLASIREVQSWEIDLSAAKMTTEDEYVLMIEGDRDPRPGDVIVSRNATVGAAALVPRGARFCMGQDVSLIRSGGRLEPEFLGWLFRADCVVNQVVSASIGSTFLRINVEQIKELVIPLPRPEEQQAIVAHIATETAKLDALRTATERTITLLRERRAALIAAAVTGQMDIGDPVAAKPSDGVY